MGHLAHFTTYHHSQRRRQGKERRMWKDQGITPKNEPSPPEPPTLQARFMEPHIVPLLKL
jgi:hypothetical protein